MADDDLVQRVARAIEAAACYDDAAVAAIAAMREPTPEMVAAGSWPGWVEYAGPVDPVAINGMAVWQFMIDVATGSAAAAEEGVGRRIEKTRQAIAGGIRLAGKRFEL